MKIGDEAPKTKKPVTGARAWVAKCLIALALRVAFGRNDGRTLEINFNEETDA